ncbi:ran-binding protein 3-like [Brevipalpus obovatus]|uniref:ran-binding protein 3-like n=1 Tax=Brevipalpus obovatus TaxID=246614 RepID=UPI003D9E5212
MDSTESKTNDFLASSTSKEKCGENSKSFSAAGPSSSTSSNDKCFVFGQNMEERVILPNDNNKEEEDADKDKSEVKESDSSVGDTNYFCSQNSSEKRKYEAITGEEDESNVLQTFCKLYLWESKTALWKERGKGMLRLNDKKKDGKLCSRLIMRTSGSLKVILNALIVVGMKFELSNERCLRFTNIDGIYLLKGKEKDIDQLHMAIECRLRELSKKVKSSPETSEPSVLPSVASDDADSQSPKKTRISESDTGSKTNDNNSETRPLILKSKIGSVNNENNSDSPKKVSSSESETSSANDSSQNLSSSDSQSQSKPIIVLESKLGSKGDEHNSDMLKNEKISESEVDPPPEKLAVVDENNSETGLNR